jgi:pimeloyl-ACP methyl ester carboxylesterase
MATMMPTFILTIWLLGLFAFALLGSAIYAGREWWQQSWTWDPDTGRSLFSPDFGWNEPTAYLAAALGLLFIAFFGSALVRGLLRLKKRDRSGGKRDPRRVLATPTAHKHIQRPDGSDLHLEFYGREDAPPMVLTHGWGLNSAEWNYLKADLAQHFRLIVWDEPGLGCSLRPRNGDFSLEKLAHDLEAVLSCAGDRKAILLGHSIGGMMTLTFCRLFPEVLATRVAGLVLAHTTHTQPLRTTKGGAFYRAIQKPIIEPLAWLTIALSPLVRLMLWLSYRNGTAHLTTKRSSFAGTESWEEIDFAARFNATESPSVLARGLLGMLRYDETRTLATITVPTLVVAGDRDTTTLPMASLTIHSKVPGARLTTLTPARHLGLIEQRNKFTEAVCTFCDSVPSHASGIGGTPRRAA